MLAICVIGWVNERTYWMKAWISPTVMVPLDRQVTAQDTDDDIAQVADKVHDGHHQAGEELGFPGRIIQYIVEPVELLDALRLAVEGFHHHVAAIHFFDMAVDMPQIVLLVFESISAIA